MRLPAAPDPCTDDEAAECHSEDDRREKKLFFISEVFLFKFERVKLEGVGFHQSEEKTVWVSHFFSSSSFVHEKYRKLTSARATQKWVRGKIAQYQYYVSLSTLSWTNASVFLTHRTTDVATVDLPYVYVCVSLHTENEQPAPPVLFIRHTCLIGWKHECTIKKTTTLICINVLQQFVALFSLFLKQTFVYRKVTSQGNL